MKEKIEKIIDDKLNEIFNKQDLTLEEINFAIAQLDRKEAKHFQEEHKELMASLIKTM